MSMFLLAPGSWSLPHPPFFLLSSIPFLSLFTLVLISSSWPSPHLNCYFSASTGIWLLTANGYTITHTAKFRLCVNLDTVIVYPLLADTVTGLLYDTSFGSTKEILFMQHPVCICNVLNAHSVSGTHIQYVVCIFPLCFLYPCPSIMGAIIEWLLPSISAWIASLFFALTNGLELFFGYAPLA